jgi:transcriptional regulator of arginine metabolism
MPISTEQRARRQQAIVEILEQHPVVRQAELVGLLRERGIEATQSSISRDLRQLGIAKLGSGYQPVEPEGDPREAEQLAGFVESVEPAGPNLTVIRTAVGAAQRVAVILDQSGWSEIVGTLSGDDTIFVATRDAQGQRQLLARLRASLGEQGTPAG